MLDEFEASVATVKFQLPIVPFVSGLTGQLLADSEVSDGNYWRRNVLQSAQMETGIETLAAQGFDHFLAMGDSSDFSKRTRLHEPEAKATLTSSIETDRVAWRTMLTSLWLRCTHVVHTSTEGFRRTLPVVKNSSAWLPFL